MDSADVVQDMMLGGNRRKAESVKKPKDAEPVPAASKVETFFTTERAKTYHKADCFSIRNAMSLIEMTREEMEVSGRKPCGNCIGGD